MNPPGIGQERVSSSSGIDLAVCHVPTAWLDALTAGVAVYGPRGELLFVNRAARALLHLPDGQAGARAAFEALLAHAVRADGTPFPSGDHPWAAALVTRRSVRDILMGFDRPGHGRRVWARVSAEPAPREDGTPAQVVATLVGIDAEQRLVDRLRESEQRGRQVLDKARDAIYRIDLAGRFTYVNPAACRLGGQPASALLGRPALELVRADQRARVAQAFARQARERLAARYDELVASGPGGRPLRLGQHVLLLFEGRRARGFQVVAHELDGGRPWHPLSPAAEAHEGPEAGPAPEAPVPHVLVVDDNDVNVKVTVAMLENLGYAVDTAVNGIEALHACEQRAYDAVLMDCQMPEMDGFRATAFIREREAGTRHTPIIALTASVLPGERQKCLAAGMDDFLAKPVSLRRLDETLRRWVSGGQQPPRAARFVLPPEHPLRSLEAQGQGPLVGEIFGTFLETTPAYLHQMQAAHADADAARLASLAHSLKGAAVQVGAEELAEMCARVQTAARSGDLGGVAALLVALEGGFQGLRRTLEPQRQKLLGGLPP